MIDSNPDQPQGYSNQFEVNQDLTDPRYQRDQAFTDNVIDRLRATPFLQSEHGTRGNQQNSAFNAALPTNTGPNTSLPDGPPVSDTPIKGYQPFDKGDGLCTKYYHPLEVQNAMAQSKGMQLEDGSWITADDLVSRRNEAAEAAQRAVDTVNHSQQPQPAPAAKRVFDNAALDGAFGAEAVDATGQWLQQSANLSAINAYLGQATSVADQHARFAILDEHRRKGVNVNDLSFGG